jgi:multicomponent K+:H+ antiporter subunit D
MDAARSSNLVWWIWAAILITSLIAVVGFARAGSMLFWKVEPKSPGRPPMRKAPPGGGLAFAATFGILAAIVLLTVLADPVARYLAATADQLYAPAGYIGAVMKQG